MGLVDLVDKMVIWRTAFSFDFDLDNTATSDPGSGAIKFNSSRSSGTNLTTLIIVDDQDRNGTDIQDYLRKNGMTPSSTIKGHLKLTKRADSSVYFIYKVLFQIAAFLLLLFSPVDRVIFSPFAFKF
ncbi:MAG: hypothetical protein CM15mP45_16320 [Deltaproteobacteria bacterium]|nr:MAG: hypothetical protein CM15mP45_16320 [Deltaproteobacteria bacterium]